MDGRDSCLEGRNSRTLGRQCAVDDGIHRDGEDCESTFWNGWVPELGSGRILCDTHLQTSSRRLKVSD